MENINDCNLKDFDWSQADILTIWKAASAGDEGAKKELAKIEKRLGITSVATLSGNTEETSVFYV